jgi:peptidoglycan/xylan/chitin deacetylase (PgdA/CDA1 family)
VTYTNLAPGAHTVGIRNNTGSGGSTEGTAKWTVDTAAPAAPKITSGPAGSVASRSASFKFTGENGGSFQCSLDASAYVACTSPNSPTNLSDGVHTWSVRQIDDAGNVGTAASRTWTVDTVAPGAPTIGSGPSGTVSSAGASFAFSGEAGGTFECQLDAAPYAACTSPQAYTALVDGQHVFRARQTDAAGNVGPAVSRAWTVDTVAPGAPSIGSGPSGTVPSASASFAFGGEAGGTFECQLDTAPYTGCTSPQAYTGLAEGQHVFRVRQIDAAGNTGPAASSSWTIDTVAPGAPSIDSGPSGTVSSASASFAFSGEAGGTFECQLDAAPYTGCTSPSTYAGLADGTHSFSVHQLDATGNVSAAASRSWTIDTTAPDAPSIDSGPSGTVSSGDVSFAFASTEANVSFQCDLDGGGFAGCNSPKAYSGLTDGDHAFSVRAVDAAANMSTTTTRNFSVKSPPAVRPVSNDCSGGYVALTFDDGPGPNTPALMQAMKALNLTGVFFVLGSKVDGSPAGQQTLRDEVAAGFSVQNHTYDHASFTGASTGTQPLTEEQVTTELENTSAAIVSAGVPRPTLYRPPYGDIDAYHDLIAQHLGYRIVMPWSTPTGNIVDSQDWTGASVDQIVANVTQGYTKNGYFYPGIKADSIVLMHDGEDATTMNTIQSFQPIVDYMNSKHLCSTATIRPDATGGVVPTPAPPEPTAGNLVQNPSLESLKAPNTPAAEPVCFQQAGASPASAVANWGLTSDAHSGSVAERVDVTSWSAGDRKLVLTQRQSEKSCLADVTPEKTYSMWVWYKGSWNYSGASATKVSIATYYRNSAGSWVFWQSSPLFAPTSTWNLAYFTSAPLPADATAISFGLAISGVGNLTTDDYALAAN